MAEKDNYYLVHYIENGREVYSAVHWRDLAKFRAEFEVISITAQFRVGGHLYTDNIKQRTKNERKLYPL